MGFLNVLLTYLLKNTLTHISTIFSATSQRVQICCQQINEQESAHFLNGTSATLVPYKCLTSAHIQFNLDFNIM